MHESVREELARRVNAGHYDPSAPLPSAAALAEEFAVSAITVKRALRDLQSAGIIRSVPGLGTFVNEQRRFIRELGQSLTSLQDAKRLGFKPSIQLVSITREVISDQVFKIFNPPSNPLLCVRKLVLADGVPIMFDTAFAPVSIGDDMADEFGQKFIIDVLNERGTPVTGRTIMIDAAPASPKVQQFFSVPNGFPTLRRIYHHRTANPDFAVFGLVESPFDRMACMIDLTDHKSSSTTSPLLPLASRIAGNQEQES